MSGETDSRKVSYSTKFKERPQIFVKLKFGELCGSKSSGSHPFDNMVIIPETQIPEVIFVTLNENSYVITNDTRDGWKYPHHWK